MPIMLKVGKLSVVHPLDIAETDGIRENAKNGLRIFQVVTEIIDEAKLLPGKFSHHAKKLSLALTGNLASLKTFSEEIKELRPHLGIFLT